jgi:acyl-coenzyme A thioesterase PaaI-like protein
MRGCRKDQAMTTTTEPCREQASEFDRGTAVTAVPGAPGRYAAELDGGWRIGGGINGGLLLAVAGRALSAELGPHRDPFSVTAHYLSASRPGPAEIRTEVYKRGRSLSTAGAVLVQPEPDGTERERLRVLATYGDLDALDGPVRTTAEPPDLPSPEQCIGSALAPAELRARAELLERLDLRLDPACVGWALGEPSGRGVIQGWLRLADGREPDPLMLLFAVDALPPTTFDLGLPGWTPTLELTVHVRARPAQGWLRVRHETRNHAGGLLEEDAVVWDASGRLVAQSRQLAKVPG